MHYLPGYISNIIESILRYTFVPVMSDHITFDMNDPGSTEEHTALSCRFLPCGAESLLAGGEFVPGLGSGVEVEGSFF